MGEPLAAMLGRPEAEVNHYAGIAIEAGKIPTSLSLMRACRVEGRQSLLSVVAI
jgi:hypothetical protein